MCLSICLSNSSLIVLRIFFLHVFPHIPLPSLSSTLPSSLSLFSILSAILYIHLLRLPFTHFLPQYISLPHFRSSFAASSPSPCPLCFSLASDFPRFFFLSLSVSFCFHNFYLWLFIFICLYVYFITREALFVATKRPC